MDTTLLITIIVLASVLFIAFFGFSIYCFCGPKREDRGPRLLEESDPTPHQPSPSAPDHFSPGNEDTLIVQDQPYQILAQIGQGGFGYVFQARNTITNVLYAFKFMPCETPSRRSAAEKEAHVALRLQEHPSIVTYVGIGFHVDPLKVRKRGNTSRDLIQAHDAYRQAREAKNCLYLVTPFYERGDLRCYVRTLFQKGERLDQRKVIQYMRQICHAVLYMQARDVIHRDIKPENVLLTADLAKVVLTDFGLASSFTQDQTTTVAIAQTVAVSPPEQQQGKTKKESDWWCLGALLVLLTTGCRQESDKDGERFSFAQQVPNRDFAQRVERAMTGYDPRLIDMALGFLRWELDERLSPRDALTLLDDIECEPPNSRWMQELREKGISYEESFRKDSASQSLDTQVVGNKPADFTMETDIANHHLADDKIEKTLSSRTFRPQVLSTVSANQIPTQESASSVSSSDHDG